MSIHLCAPRNIAVKSLKQGSKAYMASIQGVFFILSCLVLHLFLVVLHRINTSQTDATYD